MSARHRTKKSTARHDTPRGTKRVRPSLNELWFGAAPPAAELMLTPRQQDVRLAAGLLAVPAFTSSTWLLYAPAPLSQLCLSVMALAVGVKLMLDVPLTSHKAMLPLGAVASILIGRAEQMAAAIWFPNGLFG